jgi:hypothetical protein
MRRCAVGLITALVVLLAGSSGFGELTPEQKKTAEALIAKFSDDDVKVREKAVEDLAKMGPEVVPLIRKSAESADDEEVRKLCRSTEEAIDREQPFIVEDGKVEFIDWRPTRVTLDVKDAKVDDVLKLIAERTGNPPLPLSTGKQALKLVTLNVVDANYWEAVDALCRAGTLGVYRRTSRPASIMPDWAADDSPRITTGPVVIKGNIYRGDDLGLHLKHYTEPRLVIARDQMKIAEVKSADGQDLQDLEQRRVREMIPERPKREGFDRVPLKPKQEPVGPVTIKGALRLTAALGVHEVKAGPLRIGNDNVEAKREADGITLAVAGVTKEAGDVQVLLTVKAADGGRLPYLLNDPTLPYGFKLEDPDGKRWGALRQFRVKSNVDGVSGRAAPNVTLSDFVVALSEKNAHATLVLSFADVPGEGPWTLVFTYPVRFVAKDFPFVMENVPLP